MCGLSGSWGRSGCIAVFEGVTSMNMRGMAALQAGFLLAGIFANATSSSTVMRIKVLNSETRSVSTGGSEVPKNCDQVNFDAYCNNSKTAILTNTLLVQEGNEPPFHIACTIDSKFSRCTSLPKGESYDARREKRGITVYYQDDRGKARKQFYALVDTDGKAGLPANTAAVAIPPAPPAAPPPQSSAAVAIVPPAGSAPEVVADKVKCNFGSTPAGAEINLDGKYVGNTPSAIGLSTGTHVVLFSMPGFAQWKRELTVLPGSELTVSAILQKDQQ
jgi:PEGA domain